MEINRRCLFYRVSEGPCMGGHCQFDSTFSSCEGAIEQCGEVNVLKRYLMERSWMKAATDRKKMVHN